MRRLLPVALAASLLALVPASPARASHTRIAGEDRYATSAEVSESAIEPGRGFVYVAGGADFPDALAAAPVAGTRRTSVLLVRRDEIPASVRAELERLQPEAI